MSGGKARLSGLVSSLIVTSCFPEAAGLQDDAMWHAAVSRSYRSS